MEIYRKKAIRTCYQRLLASCLVGLVMYVVCSLMDLVLDVSRSDGGLGSKSK